MNRKKFLQQGLLTAGAVALAPIALRSANNSEIFTEEEITEFVYAAHNDFDKTKKIVEAKPLILNCANQYKKGDFETALGGASHMGRRDIADLLVARGARMDMFNLTFLGHTDLVKKLIELNPHYLKAPGPHGFTLLHHAKVGKQEEFGKWLQDQGLKEEWFKGVFG